MNGSETKYIVDHIPVSITFTDLKRLNENSLKVTCLVKRNRNYHQRL